MMWYKPDDISVFNFDIALSKFGVKTLPKVFVTLSETRRLLNILRP